MIIRNGIVFQDDLTFARKDLYTADGLIVSGPDEADHAEVFDASGLYVLPGLIDIHSHGACGHDFSDADPGGLSEILRYEYAHGVTSYCPTSMTLPPERLLAAFESVRHVRKEAGAARIAGLNMEGPFVSPQKAGAQKAAFCREPDVSLFEACNEACGGRIRLVTLAPELPGSADFLEAVRYALVPCVGHTCADYDTAAAAFLAGACHVTHLFNAMEPFSHRQPGVIGAAADSPDCTAELICDGVHVHPGAVRAAFKLFPGRIVLISDSMRAAGLGDGVYELGGQQVTVRGRRATLPDDTLAGSVLTLLDCLRTAILFGIPAEEAVAAATATPARRIGIYDSVGSLTPGKRSDILLVDRDWNLVTVFR